MGQNDRDFSRKESRQAAKSEKRKLRSFGSSASSGADWGAVNGDLVIKAAAALAGMGGALRLGYTRDGGAFALGVYGDGEPYTLYEANIETVEEMLKGMVEDFGK